jgi:hypothetical protein
VKVVVISHHAGQQKQGDQQGAEQQCSPRDPPVVPRQITGNRNDQPRRRGDDAQLPGPEHELKIVLTTDLTPCREDGFGRNQKLDDQQRAEKTIVHVSVN